MKICAAQTKPVKGDIEKNIETHKTFVELAVDHSADIIVFPELSITGYEPALAEELATTKDDSRLNCFQTMSDKGQIIITVGMPVRSEAGIFIGMIIFQPNIARQLYCKQYLHADEIPYFIAGEKQVYLETEENKLALSICYELSVPAHAANVYKNGGGIYLSSVAKTAEGVTKAVNTLSATAKQYSMLTIMSNCVGHCDNFDCGGKTSAWNDKGKLIGQLDESTEGILIVDTVTDQVIRKNLPQQ